MFVHLFDKMLMCRVHLMIRVTVFNATINNILVISWRSILLVEEIGVPGENLRPIASD